MRAVVAGAGAGKTHWICKEAARLVSSGAYSMRIAAVSYSRKSADDLRLRMGDAAEVSTLHSLALKEINNKGFRPLDDNSMRYAYPSLPAHVNPFIVESINEWLERGYSLESWPALVPESGLPSEVLRPLVLQDHMEHLRNRWVTYSDMITMAIVKVRRDGTHIEHLLVDEAQDISPLQYELLKTYEGVGVNVVLVGDPEQAIYAFRGGSSRYLLDAPVEHELMDNYRSGSVICAAASALRSDGRVMGAIRSDQGKVEVMVCKSWAHMREEIIKAGGDIVIGRTHGNVFPYEDVMETSTAHNAKGLEWPVVNIVGAVNGVFPSSDVGTVEEAEEEHRLAYVACSRARDHLRVWTVEGRESKWVETVKGVPHVSTITCA